jgi:hypothetical protein
MLTFIGAESGGGGWLAQEIKKTIMPRIKNLLTFGPPLI